MSDVKRSSPDPHSWNNTSHAGPGTPQSAWSNINENRMVAIYSPDPHSWNNTSPAGPGTPH